MKRAFLAVVFLCGCEQVTPQPPAETPQPAAQTESFNVVTENPPNLVQRFLFCASGAGSCEVLITEINALLREHGPGALCLKIGPEESCTELCIAGACNEEK